MLPYLICCHNQYVITDPETIRELKVQIAELKKEAEGKAPGSKQTLQMQFDEPTQQYAPVSAQQSRYTIAIRLAFSNAARSLSYAGSFKISACSKYAITNMLP